MVPRSLVLFCLLLSEAWTIPQNYEDELETRLLGGGDATTNFDFVVLVKPFDSNGVALSQCGGVIINATKVLTTGSCVYKALTATVQGGSNDPNSGDVQVVNSISINIHAGFYRNGYTNDIAIIEVTPAFDLTSTDAPVSIIKMPKGSDATPDALAGKKATIYGWGYTDKDGLPPAATKLQVLPDQPIGKSKDCQAALDKAKYLMATSSFCVNSTIAQSICQLDLGGPAVMKFGKDNFYSLVGLASNFIKCPSPFPTVFTSIGSASKWIAANGGQANRK